MNFDWILEINDLETHIDNCLKNYDDLTELNKILQAKNGSAALASIYECFLKTSIRFPEIPINELKKIYVMQNIDKPAATIARKLRVDEATVYSWIRKFRSKGIGISTKFKKDILKDLLD